jgi:HEAT repeat protein
MVRGCSPDEAVAYLNRALRVSDRGFQELAASALGELGREYPTLVVPGLLKALADSDSDPVVRELAASVLRGFGGEHAALVVPALLEALADSDSDPVVRELVATALGGFGREYATQVVPALVEGIGDSDPAAQVAAIRALRQADPDAASEAVPKLAGVLQDLKSKPKVRREAVLTLAWLGPDARVAVPAIIDLVRAGEGVDAAEKKAALRALVTIDPEGVCSLPVLGEIQDTSEQAEVLQALCRAGAEVRQFRRKLQQIWEKTNRPRQLECYVNLSQIAATVNRHPRTFERYKQQGKMPWPDVEGGGGKPDEWKWSRIRPWLAPK